eukprot:TRINITY_DN22629_c0_g1_i2.p1 TRINITY_DN22629_c0_g1~~TRINITY_DN22629_c0_g1_i2.p1  ORF type:complete len:109 (+),score=40.45 TRINITY_DN22629_c0_g1_i2:506-832(+)
MGDHQEDKGSLSDTGPPEGEGLDGEGSIGEESKACRGEDEEVDEEVEEEVNVGYAEIVRRSADASLAEEADEELPCSPSRGSCGSGQALEGEIDEECRSASEGSQSAA